MQTNGVTVRKLGTGNNVGAASLSCLLALTAGQQITILVDAFSGPGTSTITVEYANLNIRRIY